MICPICGSMLPDNARFCGVCGNSLIRNPYEQFQPSYLAQPPYQQFPAQQSYQQQAFQPEALQQPISSEPPQPHPPSDYVVTDPKNSVKQAWKDITQLNGWLKRVLLIMVMRPLPVLSFFAVGYELQWATDAWRDVPKELPKGRFDRNAFLMGLFYAVIGLLTQIGTLWLIICNIIPIAGTVLWIILLFQASVFSALASLRMTLFGRFRAAFDMSDIFKKMRQKSTGLYKAFLVPWFICVGISVSLFLVCFVLTALIGMLFAGGTAAGGDFLTLAMMSIARVSWLLAILSVVAALASWALSTLAELWAYRSLGYWVGYYCYDWICDANAEAAAP